MFKGHSSSRFTCHCSCMNGDSPSRGYWTVEWTLRHVDTDHARTSKKKKKKKIASQNHARCTGTASRRARPTNHITILTIRQWSRKYRIPDRIVVVDCHISNIAFFFLKKKKNVLSVWPAIYIQKEIKTSSESNLIRLWRCPISHRSWTDSITESDHATDCRDSVLAIPATTTTGSRAGSRPLWQENVLARELEPTG